MNQNDLEGYKGKLQALAERLRGDVSGLREEALRQAGGEASGNLSNVPMHPADLGSDHFEQETNLGLLELQGATLAEVNSALDRVRTGAYGHCLRCGREIPRGRLDALPYAPHCIECAQQEQERGPLVEATGNL